VIWPLKHTNPDIPRQFTWAKMGKNEMHEYLDALVEKRTLDAQKYVDAGFIADVEWQDMSQPAPIVTISTKRLIDLIMGTDPLEIPADGVIKFKLNGENGRFFANEILAELVAKEYFPESLTEWPDGKKKKVSKSAHQGKTTNVNNELGLYNYKQEYVREIPVMDDYPERDDYQNNQQNETTISVDDKGHYRELITMIEYNHAPVFIRRVYRGDDLIWEGTSVESPIGPWTIYYKNELRCKALGVSDAAA